MKKLSAFTLTVLMILMLFTSCSGNEAMSDSGYYGNSYTASGSEYKTDSTYDTDDMPSAAEGSETGSTLATDTTALERKVIKTYRVRMETLRYEEAVALINSAVTQFGGYIAEATQEGSGSSSSSKTRTATYTIRIPAERADAYIEHISSDYNVLSSSLSTEDITDSYYGYKARLDSLVVQEERLMAMLEKAEYLDEMLQLEDKLSEVRAEINAIYSKLQLMDKSVTYSYLYLSLYEVKEYVEPEEETYIARVGASFVDAFESFATVVGEIFIVFIWLLPYLIVGVVVCVILIVIAKKNRTRKPKASKSEKETERKENK